MWTLSLTLIHGRLGAVAGTRVITKLEGLLVY
jgi:hypothetical protein